MSDAKKEVLPLPGAVTHLLEECRMVLPGIQTLFGFQLIAVFNSSFREQLTSTEQVFHLSAICLVAIAVALVMAPAAYHRQTSAEAGSADFIVVTTRLLLCSMIPLMLGICLDFYLIARLILDNRILSLAMSIALLGFFSTLWFLFPRSPALQRIVRGRR